jgi:membrane protease YdiL (CAAX protease family)
MDDRIVAVENEPGEKSGAAVQSLAMQKTPTGIESLETDGGAPPALSDDPPAMARIFRNRFGHFRAGWRLAFYAVTAVILLVPFGFVVASLGGEERPAFISWLGSLTWVAGNLALVLAAALVLGLIDRRRFAMLGLWFERRWLVELLLGLAGGLVLTAVLVAVVAATGAVSIRLSAEPVSSFRMLPVLVWIFLVAATLEELLFRGYLLQALAEGTRGWFAALVTTVGFTWAHGDNPDLTVIGLSNIFLAGLLLAVLYFHTRRLWLPIGFHLSWNLCQSWLWGFDVSGIRIPSSLFETVPRDADLITGGEFGLEGSILSTAAFVALLVWLQWLKPIRPVEQVASMWARFPTGFGAGPTDEGQ